MESKKILKKIKLPNNKQVLVTTLNTETYIIFSLSDKKKKYIKIPEFIFLSEYDNFNRTLSLVVDSINNEKLNQFLLLLNYYFKSAERPFRKKLMLKGLGYRVALIENNSILELRLGYSHSIKISIPKEDILVKVNKQNISLEGYDKALIGNFANNIRKLRLPDSYKGKGVWYKNEIKTLKELKKK